MGGEFLAAGRGEPRLRSTREVAPFLGSFFVSGGTLPGRPVEIRDGLWPILCWCWERSEAERRCSALCRLMIAEPGHGWRQEADVVDAMARGAQDRDPSRLAPKRVEAFVDAFLAAGEAIRGRRARLDVCLDFVLPRLDCHPLFPAATIEAALRAAGLGERRLLEHRAVVHPERHPYTGSWILSLRDRLRPVGGEAEEPNHAACGLRLDEPRIGRRSVLDVRLRHPRELAAYFHLNLQGAAATTAAPLAE